MFAMRIVGLAIGVVLLLSIYGSASVPSDAQVIGLDQRVEGSAPGAYYKVQVPSPGTLSVILDQVPTDMLTRIAVINEADAWLAEQDTLRTGAAHNREGQGRIPRMVLHRRFGPGGKDSRH